MWVCVCGNDLQHACAPFNPIIPNLPLGCGLRVKCARTLLPISCLHNRFGWVEIVLWFHDILTPKHGYQISVTTHAHAHIRHIDYAVAQHLHISVERCDADRKIRGANGQFPIRTTASDDVEMDDPIVGFKWESEITLAEMRCSRKSLNYTNKPNCVETSVFTHFIVVSQE